MYFQRISFESKLRGTRNMIQELLQPSAESSYLYRAQVPMHMHMSGSLPVRPALGSELTTSSTAVLRMST